MSPPPVELVCCDMAGTTVRDDGLVLRAFGVALDRLGVGPDDPSRPEMTRHVVATMGRSKIEVFRELTGSEERAHLANAAFEAAYAAELAGGAAARAVDGAADALAALRGAGLRVALTTGFAASTRDALLRALGWERIADLVLSPADAGRGRPYPDMVLTAVLRLGASDVRAVAVVGDTAADMESGRRAGASWVVGVRTGADGPERLWAAGATHVVPSVASVPALLGLGEATPPAAGG